MGTLATQVTQTVLVAVQRFAVKRKQWDNKFMTKQTIVVTAFLALALASADAALAQQTPASGAAQTPAATAPAKPSGSAQTSTAAKPGQATGAKRPATAAAPLQTAKQKASYAIGQNIGKGLKKDEVDVDGASLARGIRDAIAGNKSLLTDEEAKTALMTLATEVRAKQQVKLDQVSAANKKEGDAFLAANKAKDGVVTLP